MEGLLGRLDDELPVAARALRLVDFVERTAAAGATSRGLLRTVAQATGCVLGYRRAGEEKGVAAHPSGEFEPAALSRATRSLVLADGSEVWVQRHTGDDALDELLLERIGIALTTRVTLGTRTSGSEGLLQALEGLATEADVTRAARAAGLRPGVSYLLARIDGPPRAAGVPHPELTVDVRIGELQFWVVEASHRAWLVPTLRTHLEGSPAAAGISTAGGIDDLATRWEQARRAQRIAERVPGRRIVDFADYGALACILVDDSLRATPLWRALERVSAADTDGHTLHVLLAYCESASLRAAAERLHRHHSSVAASVQRTLRLLEVSLDDGRDRAALLTTLLAFLASSPTRGQRRGSRRPTP